MLDAIPHRLVQRVTRLDALEHDGQLKVAEHHVAADPGNIPSGPARVPGGERIAEGSHLPVHRGADPRPRQYRREHVVAAVRTGPRSVRSAPQCPAGQPRRARNSWRRAGQVMIYRIVERIERKILTPAL